MNMLIIRNLAQIFTFLLIYHLLDITVQNVQNYNPKVWTIINCLSHKLIDHKLIDQES